MTLAERSRSYRSRTIARASTMPAAPPIDCTTRAPISRSIDGASAQPRLPAMNAASPTSRTGRRPKRSDNGPYARLATALARIDRLSASCTMPGATAKLAWIAGSAGRKICSENGASAVIAASSAMSAAVDQRREGRAGACLGGGVIAARRQARPRPPYSRHQQRSSRRPRADRRRSADGRMRAV